MATQTPDEEHESDAHDHSEDHTFDPEPTQELSPGEPMTPLWLPALGIAIFIFGGVFLLLRGDDETGPTPSSTAKTAAATTTAAASRPPMKPMPPPRGKKAQPPKKISPEQMKGIRERMRKLREDRANGRIPPTPR